MTKSFSAMILSAGFGKRMLPLTNHIPKPLIEINNVSLLRNTIEFLFKIGCKKIVINTHFKHQLIYNFVKENYKNSNIIISYEKNILDTGGGLKNAISLFDDRNILVTNSDIFWQEQNKDDVIQLISDFREQDQCRLLLAKKEKTYGINSIYGDFSLKKSMVKRWKKNEKILYYSGLQIINLEILKNFKPVSFSFNEVWDLQIKNSLQLKN